MTAGTLTDDLTAAMQLVGELRGLSAPRLELSVIDGAVVAQIMADNIAVPLVGRGDDLEAAMRELMERVRREAARARRRRPPRRR